MSITIYTTGPGCHKCTATKKQFDKAGIEYDEVLLSDEPDKAKEFRDRGWLVAPVVVTDDDAWFDFRIDKILALKKTVLAAA